MIRLVFAGLRACKGCHRPIAFLTTEDGELTLGVALDAYKAQELARSCEGPAKEKFLTDLLLKLLASSPYAIREIVLDCSEEGPLFCPGGCDHRSLLLRSTGGGRLGRCGRPPSLCYRTGSRADAPVSPC